MDYIKTTVSSLSVGNEIMWNGRVCQVVEKMSNGVKVREFKNKKVGTRELKDRWHTIYNSSVVEIDKVSI